jgi:hypothetical protein
VARLRDAFGTDYTFSARLNVERNSLALSRQEASQEDAEEEAPQASEEDALAAPPAVVVKARARLSRDPAAPSR